MQNCAESAVFAQVSLAFRFFYLTLPCRATQSFRELNSCVSRHVEPRLLLTILCFLLNIYISTKNLCKIVPKVQFLPQASSRRHFLFYKICKGIAVCYIKSVKSTGAGDIQILFI